MIRKKNDNYDTPFKTMATSSPTEKKKKKKVIANLFSARKKKSLPII